MAVTDPFTDPSGTLGSGGDESMTRIARSGLWSVLAHAMAAGSVLLVSIIVGRDLGPDELGRYTFHIWMLRVIPTVLALGVPTALTRFVSEHEGKGTMAEAGALMRLVQRGHLLLLLVPTAVLALLVATGKVQSDVALVLGAGIPVALLTIDHEALLAGLRRFRDLSIVAAVVGVSQVGAALVGASLGVGWRGYLALYVGALALGLLLLAAFALRWLAPLPPASVDPDERRRFVRFAWAVALAVTAEAFLWGRPELIFLDRYRSDAELGFYSTALRLSSLASMIPLVAARALLPEFSYQQAAGRHEELQATYRNVCRLLVVVTAPLALGGMVIAGRLVTTLYGSDFGPAGTAAAILLAGSLVNALAGPSAAVVFIGPRPRLVAEVGLAAVALNAALDVALIPRFGAEGAAAVNVLVQSLSVIVGIVYAQVRMDLPYPLAAAVRILAMGGAAAVAAWGIQQVVAGVTGMLLAVALSGVLYFASMFASRILTWQECRALVGLAPR